MLTNWHGHMLASPESWWKNVTKPNTSICSYGRFLYSKTNLGTPRRVKKNWFRMAGTFCDFLVQKFDLIFISFFFSLYKVRRKRCQIFWSEESRPFPLPWQIRKHTRTFLDKILLSKIKICPLLLLHCPFLKNAWFTSPPNLLMALITSWASCFIECTQGGN